MTYIGVFVDDADEAYADQLSTPGALEVRFLPVDEVMSLAAEILKIRPQVVALDYRLDESPNKLRPDQAFKGSTLAQHLRDRAIEAPADDAALVLVSAEAKVKALYQPDKTAHDLFDRVYVKEDINGQRARIRAEVVSLAVGYETLRALSAPYDLMALTKAEGVDVEVLGAQELRLKVQEARAPHLLARTIFGLLIDRAGPLLDLADVCAFLGIAHDDGPKIERALEVAKYRGLFGDAWPRWWAHRVEDLAQGVFKRRPTGLPASERADMLKTQLEIDVAPAVSPWSGSSNELIAIACACCRRGIEIAHTVAVFEPTLPKLLARRRVCWDCIQTDACLEKSPPLVIDEIDETLAQEIKTMARPAPEKAV